MCCSSTWSNYLKKHIFSFHVISTLQSKSHTQIEVRTTASQLRPPRGHVVVWDYTLNQDLRQFLLWQANHSYHFLPQPTTVLCLFVCVCPTLPPRSACGRRPECQQRGPSPHTPPPGQGGSPAGTPAPSGSHWDPPRRSGPQQEHPDQFLQEGRRRECFKFEFMVHFSIAEYSSTPVTVSG